MSKKANKTYYLISQLCEVVDCEHKTAPYIDFSEYLVVRTSNVRNGTLLFNDIKYTTKEGFIEWTQRAVPEHGDVLFTREAPAGETCLVPPSLKICMGQRMVLLRPNKNLINPHFLSFYLATKQCRREIYEYVIGSTVTRINIDDILKIKIFCPSIAEQEKIASFLGAIDTRLTQLRRKHELLQTYKRGVMQKIFSQEIRFKGDRGKPFPDWEKKSLGEIVVGGFSNGVFNDPNRLGRGYRLINVKDMYNGNVIDINSLSRLELDEQEFKRNKAEYGDIFFTRSSLVKEGIAHSNILLSRDQDITYDGHLIRFRFNRKNYLPEFISLALKASAARKQLVSRGKTGTMTTIGQDDISTVKISIPSKPEQEKIADLLTAIDRKIKAVSRQVNLTEQFKKGLLQKMFV